MSTDYRYKTCPICGIHYAVDEIVMKYKQALPAAASDRVWYCPNGHSLVYTESEADKYRREADRLRQRVAEKDDEIAAKERELKKMKKRAAAGTCPCCKRNFSNMRVHMKKQHPEFAA